MKEIIKVITGITVLPKGETIYSEFATELSINDEAAGPFLRLHQTNDGTESGVVNIDPEEWPVFLEAIETLLGSIKLLDSIKKLPKNIFNNTEEDA